MEPCHFTEEIASPFPVCAAIQIGTRESRVVHCLYSYQNWGQTRENQPFICPGHQKTSSWKTPRLRPRVRRARRGTQNARLWWRRLSVSVVVCVCKFTGKAC